MIIALLLSLASSASTGTEVGVGYRAGDASDFDDGRVLLGHVRTPITSTITAELTGGYSVSSRPDSISGLAKTLTAITSYAVMNSADVALRCRLESWSLQAMADWSIVERTHAKGWTGGPRLVSGLVLYGAEDYLLRYYDGPESTGPVEQSTQIGAVAGASIDVWGQSQFGVRFNILNRFTFAPGVTFNTDEAQEESLRRSIITSIDMLWRL